MPNDTETQIVESHPRGEESSKELSILLQKVLGSNDSPNFTEKQIDELLSQKREITGYIHADKNTESWDNKFYFISILVFILVFSGVILFKKPEFLSEVLSFLSGAFGGILGGYGFGIKKK